jgi:hypothetical protein
MKERLIVYLFLGFILMGCRTTAIVRNFVVQRDVPVSPQFVVLPFNNYQPQILCAEKAESALIAAGVKVVRPPSTKNVEIRKEAGADRKKLSSESGQMHYLGEKSDASSLEVTRILATKVERYEEYGEISADYIVTTTGTITDYGGVPYIESISVRIIKKSSTEVLASFVTYSDFINDDMYKVLKALGARVKQRQGP